MRYFYEKPDFHSQIYGKIYICNHPVYSRCTLFIEKEFGLAIIQQRFNPENKTTWWSEIDEWIANDLYLNLGFKEYFNERAKKPINDIYPTVTVRQIMWSLKMKPLKKERWETVFDRKDI